MCVEESTRRRLLLVAPAGRYVSPNIVFAQKRTSDQHAVPTELKGFGETHLATNMALLRSEEGREEHPMRIPVGHQANLSFSSEPGKQWELWVDPDYSWHENAGEYVIEEVTSEYVVLRGQWDGRRKTVSRSEIAKVVEHSYDRR